MYTLELVLLNFNRKLWQPCSENITSTNFIYWLIDWLIYLFFFFLLCILFFEELYISFIISVLSPFTVELRFNLLYQLTNKNKENCPSLSWEPILSLKSWGGWVRQRCIYILAYSWARPATLAAGGSRRGNVFTSSVSSFSYIFLLPCPSHSSPLLSLLLPFSGRQHKMTDKGWHVLKPNTIKPLKSSILLVAMPGNFFVSRFFPVVHKNKYFMPMPLVWI